MGCLSDILFVPSNPAKFRQASFLRQNVLSTISPDDRRLQDEASGWSRLRKNVLRWSGAEGMF